MSDLKLTYGLRNLPADVTSAWGARLIWPNDLVHDRQDLKGEDTKALIDWLNGGALRVALDNAARLARSELAPSEDREVVLYEDERGVIKGNPQASHGYLYVAGWLK